MLPLFGDLNWFKDLALPCLLTFLCTWILASSGWLLRNTRLRVARRQAQKEINRALITVTSDYQGGITPWLLLQVAHLIVRCTLFLSAIIATATFFLILHVDKSSGGSAVIVLSAIAGISAKMVHSVLEEIGSLTLAQTLPSSYISKIEGRLGPIYAVQFAKDLKQLKSLAEQTELARKGRNSAEILAGRLNSERKDEPQPEQSTTG